MKLVRFENPGAERPGIVDAAGSIRDLSAVFPDLTSAALSPAGLARHFQLERGETWDRGKGCETFGPVGPWLVTREEVGDVLAMWLDG